MAGNVVDRMAYWPRVEAALEGVPVRRIWEIFNKMLIDREKFILGRDYGWLGYGFLFRTYASANYGSFIGDLTSALNSDYGMYPPYPAQSGLPVLDSYAKIAQYASAKYPDLHRDYNQQYWTVGDYHPEECYMTAAAGGDDDYAFLNQNQLFEKLWNFLHYFGGVKLGSLDRTYGIPYLESNGQSYAYSIRYYASGYNSGHGFRFMYTPSDDLEYKYICHGYASGMEEGNGIVTHLGPNVLYESDWMRGPFTSPLLKENSGKTVDISTFNLNVYPHWPDFYDPETLKPVYFT